MLTYLNKVDHVFTKEELIKDLDRVIDSTKDTIDPDQLNKLQKVREGIVQVFARIDQLNQTIANLQKVNDFYKAKINSYVAEEASYPTEKAQGIKQTQEKDIDPAEEALRKIKEFM